MNRVKPTFWTVYFSKNNTGLLTVWTICLWMMFLSSDKSADYLNPYPLLWKWLSSAFLVITILALFVLALSLLVAWKDYRKLSYMFKDGVEITGKILSINFENKYAGRVQYEYQFQQREYIQMEYFLYGSVKKIRNLHVDQEITLYVNPEDPYHSCIRDLYLKA